jgi:thiol-disulfide isomerase/thioredoxin
MTLACQRKGNNPLLRRYAVVFVMLAAVALLAVAGVYNLRARRATMQKAQQAQMNIVRDGQDAPGTPHLRGKAAPGFTLAGLDGKKVSLGDFKGHPVVVNFWATWCAPCKLEMPWFQEFSTKYKGEGLQVLGISEDDGASRDDIAKAAGRIGVTYPILLTDGKVAPAYGGVEYLPETFYIAGNGVVVAETAGAPTKDEMEANIRKAIAAGAQ